MIAVGLGVQVAASPSVLAQPRPVSDRLLVVAQSGTVSKIFSLRPDGRDWARLTDRLGSEADVCAGPDGDFVYYRSLEDGVWSLYRWNISSSQSQRLTWSLGLERQPRPSPDGRWLAYTSDAFGQDEIMLLSLENLQEEPRRLTWDQGQNSSPSWSPDSRTLVFSSRRNGQADLYQVEIESGQQRRLTATDQDEVDPRWSPDGRSILFQTTEGRYRKGQLGLLDHTSGQLQTLETPPGTVHQADWGPDGNWLVYLNFGHTRNPSSPRLLLAPLDQPEQAQAVEVIRRALLPWHWSFRQVQWVRGSGPFSEYPVRSSAGSR